MRSRIKNLKTFISPRLEMLLAELSQRDGAHKHFVIRLTAKSGWFSLSSAAVPIQTALLFFTWKRMRHVCVLCPGGRNFQETLAEQMGRMERGNIAKLVKKIFLSPYLLLFASSRLS